MNDKPSLPPIRRVVTGHDGGNVAKVMIDSPASNAKCPGPGLVSTLIWTTDATPAASASAKRWKTWAHASSARRRLAPGSPLRSSIFRRATKRTCIAPNIDYVIVIEGEIEMHMDDPTVKLKAGDVMVQRGTNHAWANRQRARARRFRPDRRRPLGPGKPVTAQSTRAET